MLFERSFIRRIIQTIKIDFFYRLCLILNKAIIFKKEMDNLSECEEFKITKIHHIEYTDIFLRTAPEIKKYSEKKMTVFEYDDRMYFPDKSNSIIFHNCFFIELFDYIKTKTQITFVINKSFYQRRIKDYLKLNLKCAYTYDKDERDSHGESGKAHDYLFDVPKKNKNEVKRMILNFIKKDKLMQAHCKIKLVHSAGILVLFDCHTLIKNIPPHIRERLMSIDI